MTDKSQPHNEEDKIRPTQVAFFYGVTTALIYEWRSLGKGPKWFTDERGIFFTRETIAEHLENDVTLAKIKKQKILERIEKNIKKS
jgi:hypothetical protein